MEKRGRKREDKIRTIIALSPELIESIKDLSKQSGKNVSLFIEEVLALTGKPKYVLPRWDRHERKKICFRLSQSSIDYIKDVTNRDKVSKECLIDAKLREYESSPQRILDKTYPVAVEYITTGNVSKDDFFDAFKNLCVAYYTETAGDFQRRKDYRTIVGQKLAIRCIRSLTDSQLLSLDKVLQEFCEIEENYNNLQPSNRQKDGNWLSGVHGKAISGLR